MKKILSLLLVFVMIVSMLPVTTHAAGSVVDSGKCGENATYTWDGYGTLTISGTGPMYDCNWTNRPWYQYHTSIARLIVEEGITNIASSAFYNCSSLSEFQIADTVTHIGDSAFQNCQLGSITLPKHLDSIGRAAFAGCSSLESIMIPDGVTSIGFNAFQDCTALKSVELPAGLTMIHSKTFAGCSSLESIIIPDGVTLINTQAFKECTALKSIELPAGLTTIAFEAFAWCSSLESIMIPDSVTYIPSSAFRFCTALKSIELPAGLTMIDGSAFEFCSSLESIVIPGGVTSIGYGAFSGCDQLSEITFEGNAPSFEKYAFSGVTATAYYPADNSTWKSSKLQNYGGTITWVAGTSPSKPSISGLRFELPYDHLYAFVGDSHIYNMDSIETHINYIPLKAYVDKDVLAFEDIAWSVSDPSIFQMGDYIVEEDGRIHFEIKALSAGTATLTATNPQGESISQEVTVFNSNALQFKYIYDAEQEYESGTFFTEQTSFSDSVEIALQFTNAAADLPCEIEEHLEYLISEIKPITITATVSGDDLSFRRDSYENTYTTVCDPIAFGQTRIDVLTLFPFTDGEYDVSTPRAYTVDVTLESESLTEPVTQSFAFTVGTIEWYRVEEHVDFAQTDINYIVSKNNSYGKNMVGLKNDPEYHWSKWSTKDLENYYEVVWADVMIGLLSMEKQEESLQKKMFKERSKAFSTILKGITTAINESYADIGDTETNVDKLLKASKYSGEASSTNDKIYEKIMTAIKNPTVSEKVQKAFVVADKTTQVAGFVSMAGNVFKDIQDWTNTVSLFNAYNEADQELKQVMKDIADKIPFLSIQMKEAINDYVHASANWAGMVWEVFESGALTMLGVTHEMFKGAVGKSFVDFLIANVNNLVSKKAWSVIGGVSVGIEIGLCISDLISNSGDKAAEMGKIIAMSEYAPYIIETLEEYEDAMISERTNESVDAFEWALELHKSSQAYIANHTQRLLEAKGGSLLVRVFRPDADNNGINDAYDEVIADAMAYQLRVENIECCNSTTSSDSMVIGYKVIAVKCPVDVYVYDENGNEAVRIVADVAEYVAEGIKVLLIEDEKFILIPNLQDYRIQIIATDGGVMSYSVLEYEGSECKRTLRKAEIPLVEGRVFTGCIPHNQEQPAQDYSLTYDIDKEIVPEEILPNADIKLGDENGDGKLNAKDATAILKYIVGKLENPMENFDLIADVNGDNKVNAKDATKILKTIVDKDTIEGWN